MSKSSKHSRILTLLLFIFLLYPDLGHAQFIAVEDLGRDSKFQNVFGGHLKRGRANVSADFNLDGRIDFFIGSPGDQSIVLRNESSNGEILFELQQTLLDPHLAWGAVAFDYDNDRDYDLFITCGANEGIGYDFLFRNDWILNGVQTGELVFTDVTVEAGVAGPIPIGETSPARTASANAVTADYDQDGDTDLFVNGNINAWGDPNFPDVIGLNTLYRNNGDGTFTDVTEQSGLSASLARTRHSTFLDIDADGDMDLFENNYTSANVLWQNNGDGTFSDVTAEWSFPGQSLEYPLLSFASATADFNNDGLADLIMFKTGWIETGSPYTPGHALYMNRGGMFENVANQTGINENYIAMHGVMGCQVGDLNADGIADIYIGNGDPGTGTGDQFFLSYGETNDSPLYHDATSYIDFPAELPIGVTPPPYPYRTHGTTFIDVDSDGSLEIAVVNGGPSFMGDEVREPNRLFKLTPEEPHDYFRIRLVGNGIEVSRDAIGSSVELVFRDSQGTTHVQHKGLYAGNGFSAQNGFYLHFGMEDAASIESIQIRWPNNNLSLIEDEIELNSTVTMSYDSLMHITSISDGIGSIPEAFKLHQNYPNPFNPTTTLTYDLALPATVNLGIYNVSGQLVKMLVKNKQQSAKQYTTTWDGTDNSGNAVASGVYIYRLSTEAGTSQAMKMLLVR